MGGAEGEWRETNARFEGPAVRQLEAAFVAAWAEATGELLTGRVTLDTYEGASTAERSRRSCSRASSLGHVKGAFTGALRDRVGRFQHADGGTLFLDEIAEIPLAHQAKLLRVLQEGQFERVGDDRTRTVNVRLIAATNRDLRAEVAAGRFRQDLFYRISVFPLELPPLRQRPEDIPALAHHFASLFTAQLNRPTVRLTHEDAALLMQYDWPGNVRELQNVMERAIILARGSRLRLDLALAYGSLQPLASDPTTETPPASAPEKLIRREELKGLERDSIIAALERAHRRVSGPGGAAALLGVNPNTLTSRMRSLGIKRKG